MNKKTKKEHKNNKVDTNKIVEEVIEKAKEEVEKENKEIIEKEENKNNKKDNKKSSKNVKVDKKVMEEIEEVRKEQEIPLDVKRQMNDKVFKNIIIAIFIMLFLVFVNLGYMNIKAEVLVTDLKVFSVTLSVLAILIFEKAYKKDSGKLAINGIEVLMLAILTLVSIGVLNSNNNKFPFVIAIISFLFGIYYTGKSILEYLISKKKYLKQNSDIKEIIKK